MSTRSARVVRGLLVAVIAITVAAVAHIAGGGHIGSAGLALALAFSALASISLAGRTVSRVRVSIAVLFSQGIFHVLFGIGADSPAMPQSHMLGMTMGDPGAPSALATQAASVSMPDDGWMWVAHIVAAVLTVIALVTGERTFWRLAEFVVFSLARAFAAAATATIERTAAPGTVWSTSAPGTRFLVSGMQRRGPPRVVASA